MNVTYHFRAVAWTGSLARVRRGRLPHPWRAGEARSKLRMHVRLAGWMLLLALITAPSASRADENESSFSRFSWGLGAGICTLVYTPLKVAYAATTIPIGGLVWLWSVGDAEIAARVISRGTTGDFVLTPEHLKGERPLVFVGDPPVDNDR